MTAPNQAEAYHVCVYQLPTPQHVYPEPDQSCQVSLGFICKVVLEHALEGFQLRKHGKEQGVQVAGNVSAVLSTKHVHVGIVGDYGAGDRLLMENEEFHGLFDVACRIVAPYYEAEVVRGYVVQVV